MSQLFWIAAILILGTFVLVPLIQAQNRTNVINADEAREKIDAGAQLIDVRTPREFAQNHIPGAINIPLQELGQRHQEINADEAVLYCRSGNRSQQALRLLQSQGHEQIYDLGAMSRW